VAKRKPTGAGGKVEVLGWQGGTRGKALPGRVPDGAPGPLGFPDPGRVRFRTKNKKHDLTMRLDDEPAALTPQVPRIEQVDIPWRASQSQWLGQTPTTLTISAVMDAYPWGSIEDDWETLESMCRPELAGRSDGAPSPLQISGSVPGQDRWWQITEVECGEAIWAKGMYRQRQHLTLTLTQWLPVGRTDTSGRSNPRTSSGKVKARQPWTVNAGETLSSIALRALGDSGRWREIAKANKVKGKARRSPDDLKVGERLKLPKD
jgi:LysM repeat protein